MGVSFRDLPAIEKLLGSPAIRPLSAVHGEATVKRELRALQSSWRAGGSLPDWAAEPAAYADALRASLDDQGYRPVFNLTGTIIHTNLGRALLSPELYQAVEPLVTRPMNLEYEIATSSWRTGSR